MAQAAIAKPAGVIRDLPVAVLAQHPRNYKAHPRPQVERLALSLQRYGQRKAIVVQASTNMVVAGHGILAAAKQLGWQKLRCDVWDCTDAEARAYLVDDNELERGADPDSEALLALIEEAEAEGAPVLAFDEEALAALKSDDLEEFGGAEPLEVTQDQASRRWLLAVAITQQEKATLDAKCAAAAVGGEPAHSTVKRLIAEWLSSPC